MWTVGGKHLIYYLIEFKYCKDTRPEDQLEAWKSRHATLMLDLKTGGQAVHLVPIVLIMGHPGTIIINNITHT